MNFPSVFHFLDSGPDRGQSPVEWGDFTFVCPPPQGHPARPEAQPARPEAQPARPEAQPASPEAQAWVRPGWLGFRPGWLGLRPGWLSLRPGWMALRGDGRTNKRTENLPIIQDFIPYRGRCPASPPKKQGYLI